VNAWSDEVNYADSRFQPLANQGSSVNDLECFLSIAASNANTIAYPKGELSYHAVIWNEEQESECCENY
jgi:hypothetical protein